MDFAGINHVAVVIAAIALMAVGAGWYGGLGKQWMRAAKLSEADIEQKPSLYIIAGICQLIIAFFLAGKIDRPIYSLYST